MIKSPEQIRFEEQVNSIVDPLRKEIKELTATIEVMKKDLIKVQNRRMSPYAGRLI